MNARAVKAEVTVIDRLFSVVPTRALYWAALAITDDEASAEDAVHEAFLYLCEHREEFYNIKDPFSYLAAITKHRALDARKHIALVQAHEGRIAYEIENSGDIPL